MAFVNTRDALGDQATVDGLVEHNLTELKEDGIGIIETYACYHNTGLQSLELPGVSQIKANAFNACSNLEVVKLGGEGSSNSMSIAANAFKSCAKLKHLIIDRPAMATLSSVGAFDDTPINVKKGAIYVPENLVATYKANNTWKNFFINKLTDYPLSDFSTISDSWLEIKESMDNGTYTTKYALGDTKSFLINGELAYAMIVNFGGDDKADGSGKAKITWLIDDIYALHVFNNPSVYYPRWSTSSLRSWLQNDIYPLIENDLKSIIVSVTKSSYMYNGINMVEDTATDDIIWVPSPYELHRDDMAHNENYPRYYWPSSFKFSNNWWSRNAYPRANTMYAFQLSTLITTSTGDSSSNNGVVFGFCTD